MCNCPVQNKVLFPLSTWQNKAVNIEKKCKMIVFFARYDPKKHDGPPFYLL